MLTVPQGFCALPTILAAGPARRDTSAAPAARLTPMLATSDGHPATGLPLGAEVLTADGVCRAEALRPGQRIITRDRGLRALRGTSQRTATADLVRVEVDAFGPGCPEVALWLPATQLMLLRAPRASGQPHLPQKMVPLGRLVDGAGIRAAAPEAPQRIVTLSFDAPHVIYAAGLELLAGLVAPAEVTTG